MKKRNYRKFKNPKLQKMVIEEIKSRMKDSENAPASIIAFMAHNFEPNEQLKRTYGMKCDNGLGSEDIPDAEVIKLDTVTDKKEIKRRCEKEEINKRMKRMGNYYDKKEEE